MEKRPNVEGRQTVTAGRLIRLKIQETMSMTESVGMRNISAIIDVMHTVPDIYLFVVIKWRLLKTLRIAYGLRDRTVYLLNVKALIDVAVVSMAGV